MSEWETRYKEVSDELEKINAKVGKAVERDGDEEDEEEEGEGGEGGEGEGEKDDEEGTPKPKKL